jgi:tetratricopeptide (TPR) repeat protein
MHRNVGQFAEAQKLFEQALTVHNDFEEAHLGLASVLRSQGMHQEALPHLQKAISLNPQNEVSWYQLAQVERSLGNVAEQQRALAVFRRLHDKANQQNGLEPVFSPSEVTKQEVDPNAAQ